MIPQKLGYTNVVLGGDGEIALKEFELKSFDLIISDWHMPNMDGLDFYKALSKNQKWSDIPFLLITAEKERNKVVEAGSKEYLVKPVKPENLSNKIKEVVLGRWPETSHQHPEKIVLFLPFSFYNPASFLIALALSVFSHVKELSFLPKCP